MKLMNGTLRPGIIREVLKDGKIKATAPGLFTVKDELDKLPPIMPFFGGHANSYSEPILLDEVWILNFSDNPQQLYWFRKDKFEENNNESILDKDSKNVEILCNRESGMGWASIYFSDGTGWIIKNDDSLIQIDKEGNITLTNGMPHRTIKINGEGIFLGGGKGHPAVHGDSLLGVLLRIVGTLELIQMAAQTTPFTAAIAAAVAAPVIKLKMEIPSILSDHVKLD